MFRITSPFLYHSRKTTLIIIAGMLMNSIGSRGRMKVAARFYKGVSKVNHYSVAVVSLKYHYSITIAQVPISIFTNKLNRSGGLFILVESFLTTFQPLEIFFPIRCISHRVRNQPFIRIQHNI